MPIHTNGKEKEGDKTAGQNIIIKSLLNNIAPNHAHLVKLHENRSVLCKPTCGGGGRVLKVVKQAKYILAGNTNQSIKSRTPLYRIISRCSLLF
jgi:hypothetical protein